jgi:lipopolysaccharide/colanic/teichoic acid biosynthesis glycosyltransferase
MILLPFSIFIYLLILLTSGYPVFFKQERVGKNWEIFYIYKFRTMKNRVNPDDAGVTSIDDSRITKLGRFLRKYKIDEVPQLINVLWGKMSIVGPRPELKKFAIVYQNDYDKILKLKPGISDFASIKYYNENYLLRESENPEMFYLNNILPDKISLNKKYISEASFYTDFKIILSTLKTIFK